MTSGHPVKLLVTYFPGGDTYTEVVASETECVTPSNVADFIGSDAYAFSANQLLRIINAASLRLTAKNTEEH